MKYIVYRENPGPKAKQGDFVTIEMVYKTEHDSVLFNSNQNNRPMRFQLNRAPFQGSMEEGLTCMAAGDSATFFVSADSMVRNVFSKRAAGNYVRPGFLPTGSFLKFDIKLVRIQNELDAAEEIYRDLDKRSELENASIDLFLKDHHILEQPGSDGIFIIRNKNGNGAAIDSGKTVSVNYTGKFLTGEVFDSNAKLRKPYSFVVGRGEVMKGWDVAFQKLREGEHVTLIIPSSMAYGEEGVINKMNGAYVVPPNTPLLFEVEIVSVK